MTPLSGRFYRIAFAADAPGVLEGVKRPEGRFHHDGQPAIYMSPTKGFAAIAVDAYLRPDDPPRVTIPLQVSGAHILDIRDPATEPALGLRGGESVVPWRPERAAFKPATSWHTSDAARAAGVDGMIYPARSTSERWHLVLFRWNFPGAAIVRKDGAPTPFHPV